jgi:ribosome-binding factor A
MAKFTIINLSVSNDGTATVTVETSHSDDKICDMLETHDGYTYQLGMSGWDNTDTPNVHKFYYDGTLNEGYTIAKTSREAQTMVRKMFALI